LLFNSGESCTKEKKPYEIYLVPFDTEQDFDSFKQDEERKKFLHLKEKYIKTSLLIKAVWPKN
jgi:hypothetical protein